MNKVILCGRLTRDPEVRYTQGEKGQTCIARYALAIERKYKKEGYTTADFINCVAFGKTCEFAEKYFRKGMKVLVVGRIQTGSLKNKDGQTVYTTDVVIEEQEFCEKKGEFEANPSQLSIEEGFMNIPEGIEEELPFN